jgi:putative transcriptional regulator
MLDQNGTVPLVWSDRLIGPRAVILALATFLLTVRLVPAQTPEPASVAGQLLVASPTMGDPRFSHTVILMVEHNRDGAFGIIINLPIEERPLASLLESLGEKNATVTGSVRIFAGGPVQPEVGFVVHSTDYRRPGTIGINGSLAVTSSREILLDISNNKGPTKSLVAFGYAGWGPGQLENELGLGAWFIASADPKLVFDEDRERLWDLAYSHRTQDL